MLEPSTGVRGGAKTAHLADAEGAHDGAPIRRAAADNFDIGRAAAEGLEIGAQSKRRFQICGKTLGGCLGGFFPRDS